jgi:hypothetical protein
MLKRKKLPQNAIPAALDKARHYRLLNNPWQSESICRDILSTDPGNQEVIYTLILAITDQFDSYANTSPDNALELASRLTDKFQTEYISGLIFERLALATFGRQGAHSGYIAYSQFKRAMEHYEKAEKIQTETDKEPILRWNACVRFIQKHDLKDHPEEEWTEPFLDV